MLLMMQQLSLTSSGAAGIPDSQECIDFCAKHKIEPKTELIDWTQLDRVFEELDKGLDRVVRYVLDCEKGF